MANKVEVTFPQNVYQQAVTTLKDDHPYQAFKSFEQTCRSLLSLSSLFLTAYIAYISQAKIFADVSWSAKNISWPHTFLVFGLLFFIATITLSSIFLVRGAYLTRAKRASILDTTVWRLFYASLGAFFIGLAASCVALITLQ